MESPFVILYADQDLADHEEMSLLQLRAHVVIYSLLEMFQERFWEAHWREFPEKKLQFRAEI